MPDVRISTSFRDGSVCDEIHKAGDVRSMLGAILKAQATEIVLSCVILVNLVLLVIETDSSAEGGPIEDPVANEPPMFVATLNRVLLAIYTIELLVRLFVHRIEFFYDSWCVMDFAIVGSDLLFLLIDTIYADMPKLSVLRCARLVRLARAFKALSKFPELHALMVGFLSAFRAICWGTLMIIFLLVIWSILAVQILHPVNRRVAAQGLYDGCHRCPDAFATVWASMCTFFQTLVAGDSWGTVALPIIDEQPTTFVIFLCVLVSVSMAIMNLILAVIVDSGQQARQESMSNHDDFQQAAEKFRQVCSAIDQDSSGTLSLQDLVEGYNSDEEFATMMRCMGIRRQDIETIFLAFDKDASGEVEYSEFIMEAMDCTDMEPRQMLLFMKLYMEAIMNELKILHNKFKSVPDDGVVKTVSSSALPKLVTELKLQDEPRAKERAKTDEIAELKQVNQELVAVMKDMVEQTRANYAVLAKLDGGIPDRGSLPGGSLRPLVLPLEAQVTAAPEALGSLLGAPASSNASQTRPRQAPDAAPAMLGPVQKMRI